MKIAILFTIVFCGVFFSIAKTTFGQAPPPPPPPLIYSPPKEADIKEFSDSDNKFKVWFPGIPEKNVWVGDKVNQITFKVYRNGSNSVVSILIFPVNMESNSKELINSYREKLPDLSAQAPKSIPSKVSNLLIDREIEIGGHKGHEFGYESDFHFTRVAIFTTGNRFFEIKTDITNWHILKRHNPEIVKAFQSESDRFIKSFVLIK